MGEAGMAMRDVDLGLLNEVSELADVTDIAVTCDGCVWVDRGEGMREIQLRMPFRSPRLVRDYAVQLCAQLGRRLDDACPIADACSADGMRVHAVIAPLVPVGAALSIRFPIRTIPSLDGLEHSGMFPPAWKRLLIGLVRRRATILITGGTGVGKTTLLKALLSQCDEHERLITVEEVRELGTLGHGNHVSLVAREANVEGAGAVGLSELVKATLRMRPDRVILGEARGEEIVDLLRAFNSGHQGGLTTLHANSVGRVPGRLMTLGLLAGVEPRAMAMLAGEAFHAVLHVERAGRRRCITQIGMLRIVDGAGLVGVPLAMLMMVVLWPSHRQGMCARLDAMRGKAGECSYDGDVVGGRNAVSSVGTRLAQDHSRIAARKGAGYLGLGELLSSGIARVRSGGTVAQAFGLGSSPVTVTRLLPVMTESLAVGESVDMARQVAIGVVAACRVCDELGCGMARCLQTVASAYRRARLMDDLRRQAFAMPQATARLLMVLPAGTVLLGEMLGLRPLGFLLHADRGFACLALGCCCYIAGLAWNRALLRGMSSAGCGLQSLSAEVGRSSDGGLLAGGNRKSDRGEALEGCGNAGGYRKRDDGYDGDDAVPWLTLILEMLSVALRQGTSIPRALSVVGSVCGGAVGLGMSRAGAALLRGVSWRDAWVLLRADKAYGHVFEIIASALESSWVHGDSPLIRLETTIERLDGDERSAIEQAASRLSVRLLLPSGLCFLPAFVFVGIVPCLASVTL